MWRCVRASQQSETHELILFLGRTLSRRQSLKESDTISRWGEAFNNGIEVFSKRWDRRFVLFDFLCWVRVRIIEAEFVGRIWTEVSG